MAMTPMKSSPAKDDGGEGITVAIRMRPLNDSEGDKERIWKVLPRYSSVTQTTRDGKPLSERVTGRTFFTFDKTFGEDTNNQQVYDGVASGIVGSVVQGLNGTIFAYGQTSSGKTYTMQGSGNLEQGSSEGAEGGLVHMAARDIFSQIQKQPDRIFLVRVSFLEIYNEEVRDLLAASSQTLQIREDPRRGVFVQSVEEIVTDFESLLKILTRGDKSRTFASTGMNERSSRSHTILRVTIESREKDAADESSDEDENHVPNGDGAVRISTLNLVDLAGSESVRHTGATGERQKEGGLINQSLLTLSRVIVALGTPNQTHVNFRDSKLTRILQPSLSGNARMAVICCATPSELYLEETRSTLQFASRAKLVKTNAQVNEVLDERSMIRRLQRELAEAKRKQSGMGDQQVKDLEKQVETAGTQAMEAKAKLDRLKASILNAGYLFDPPSSGSSNLETSQSTHIPRKRRKSEGSLLICQGTPLKRLTREGPSPKTAPRHKKIQMLHHPTLPPNQELRLVQEALSVQNRLTRELKGVVQHYVEQIKEKDLQLQNVVAGNSTLSQQNSEAADELRKLQDIVASLQQSLQTSIRESEELLSEKETQANASLEKLQQSLVERSDLEEKLNDLTLRFEQVNQERIRSAFELAEITSEKELLMKETASDKIKLNEMAGKTEFLTSNLNEATKERDVALLEIDSLRAEMEICRKKNSDIQQSQEKLNIELKETVETLVSQNDDLRNANDCLATQVRSSKEEILALQSHLMTLEQAMEDRQEKYDLDREFTVSKMREMAEENSQLRQDKATNECSIDQLEKKITESDSLLQEQVDKNQVLAQQLSAKDKKVQILEKVQAETQIVVSSLRTEVENSRQSVSTLSLEKEELAAKKSSFEQQCSSLSVNLEAQRENNAILETANQQLSEKVEILEKENIELIAKLEESRVEHTKIVERLETCQFELEEELERVHSQNQDLFASSSELQQASIAIENEKAALMDSIEILREEKNAIEAALAKERERVHSLTDQKDLVLAEKNSIEALLSSYKGSVDEMENQLTAAEAQISRLQREKDAAIAATGQALANIQTLSSQLKSKQNDIANLDFTKRELEKKFEETQAEVTALSQKIEATEAQLHETTCELQCFAQKSQEKDLQIEKLSIIGEEAKRDYERKTSSLENELDSMQRKFSQLKEDCSEIDRVAVDRELQLAQVEEEKSNLLCQMHDLSVRNDEMKSVCESIQSELTAAREKEASLKEELERSSISRDQFIQNLRECEAQRDKATAEVADLYEKNRQLSESISCCLPKEREEELRAEIAQLKIENKEARQLLASVNDSEDRLRTKVLQLENDLKLSYAELEGMMVQLSQRNEELTRAKKDLEEHSNIEESHSQLVQRIDALQRKNAEVEQLLLDEKKAWKAREEDLMHQMGEEQRALLQEGENQMSSLREELQECEAKLSQAESEAYTARQHVEELHDERRSLDEAYHGLKNQVTTLDSANIKLEAQVSELQSELSKAKSECYALKESAIDMKEKMRRSARDYEKAMKENEVAAKDVVTLRKKVGSLEKQIESNQTENSRLRKKYQDVEKSEKHLMALKEEVTAKTLEIEYLQKKITDLEREKQEASTETERRVTRKTRSEGLDVERLKEELQQKDQRIKKLEAVRMTKDQMAKIKSIKAANKELETKCSNLKNEISRLNEHILSMGADSELRTEISELRFDKEALERKLRKFATHCQRLEDDKAGMADALRSCNIDIESYDNDIGEAIIHLCDRLTSLEESRPSQNRSGRSSPDSLLQENENLRNKIDSLTVKLSYALKETNDFKKATKNRLDSHLSEEFQRKLGFLEQENLQLIQDLKAAKIALSNTKNELETLRLHVKENQTIDFAGMGIEEVSNAGMGEDTMELTKMARKFSRNAAPNTTGETRDTQNVENRISKRPILSDATNQSLGDGNTMAEFSASKRQRVEDVSKTIRQRRLASDATKSKAKSVAAPGLGESSSVENSESTGECQQS